MRKAGWNHSEETSQKIREANLLREPASSATRQKQSDSAKLRTARGISDETRNRMAEAQKKRHAANLAHIFCEQENIPLEVYEKEIANGNGWCKKCKTFQPIKEFTYRKGTCLNCLYHRNQGWYRRNRDAVRQRMRERYAENIDGVRDKNRDLQLRKFGANFEWYNKTLKEQDFKCAICRTAKVFNNRERFCIDHLHGHCQPNRACDICRRGLLCGRCNSALERVDAIPDWTEKALSYLRKYNGVQ